MLAATLIALLIPVETAHAASCTEPGVFQFATDPVQGINPTYAYPVNGIEGQLNASWTHHFDATCGIASSHETDGIVFLWQAGNDWIEIGDQKTPGYSNYGNLWDEWHIYPHAVTFGSVNASITTPLLGLNAGFVGTPGVFKWRLYYDPTGTYRNWSTADTIYGLPSDRGGGYQECSHYYYSGTSDCPSSQAYINYRLPADGLWHARSTHTWCYEQGPSSTDPWVDTLAGSAYPNVTFGPEVNNQCYP